MISENISRAKSSIASACARAGRAENSVKLVAITKNRSIQDIKEAVSLGLTDLGENRVQEALLKYQGLKGVSWQMVGHLQTNKVRDAVKIFDLIQSVDSLRLAVEINKEAAKAAKIQDVLLEVKISPEPAKSGFNLEEFTEVIKQTKGLKNLNIRGLMGIAPIADSPQQARPYFRKLRELRDKIDQGLILSMGMSDDFEVAIEEGSDMVRIGRAIFD